VLVWIVPLAVLILAARFTGELERRSIPVASARWTVVGERSSAQRQPASVHWMHRRSAALMAPRAGRVTALLAQPGQALASGDPVVALDGSPVPVMITPIPMYRDLSEGAVGADVAALNGFLATLGLGGPGSGVDGFTEATTVAVEGFQERFFRSPDGVFRPGDVIFAAEPVTLRSWSVALGVDVGAGAPLGSSSGPVGRVVVVTTASPGLPAIRPDVAIVLMAGGDRLQLTSSEPKDQAELASAGAFFERHGVPEDGGDSAAIGPPGPNPSTEVTVELAAPRRVGAVPATAVVSSSDGDCIVTRSHRGAASRTRPVQVTPSPEVGVAYVDASLIGADVKVVAGTRSCR